MSGIYISAGVWETPEVFNSHPRFLDVLLYYLDGAFMEELIFRAPLAIVLGTSFFISGSLTKSLNFTLLAALILSVIFGLAHIPQDALNTGFKSFLWAAWPHLLLQGIGGLILSILFLKFGVLQQQIFRPLIMVVLIHVLHNIAMFYM